jgi:hypothetical protein
VAVGQPVEEGGPLGDGHGAGRPVRTVLGVPDQHGVPAEPDLDAGNGADAVTGLEPRCVGRGSGLPSGHVGSADDVEISECIAMR